MLVSIITATFNSAATIADTMRSVEEQDYPLIDHIVVDGHSQDEYPGDRKRISTSYSC